MTVLSLMNETWIIIRLKKHRYLRALKTAHFETVSVGRCCLHTFVYLVSMCDWRCLVVAWRRCCCVFCLITAGSNYHTATTPPPATSHGVNHPVNTRILEIQTKVIRGSRRFHNHREGRTRAFSWLKAVKVSTKFRDNSPHRTLVCRIFADQCVYLCSAK